MKYIKQLFIIILCAIASICNAQRPLVGHLTKDDGLASNSVRTIYKDKIGFVYFGTSVGIDVFSGQKVRQLAFPLNGNMGENWVNGIAEDEKGVVVVGADNGLWEINQKKFSLIRIFEKEINCRVSCISAARDGRLFVEIDRGLFEISKGKLRTLRLYKGSGGDLRVRDLAFSYQKGKLSCIFGLSNKIEHKIERLLIK